MDDEEDGLLAGGLVRGEGMAVVSTGGGSDPFSSVGAWSVAEDGGSNGETKLLALTFFFGG